MDRPPGTRQGLASDNEIFFCKSRQNFSKVQCSGQKSYNSCVSEKNLKEDTYKLQKETMVCYKNSNVLACMQKAFRAPTAQGSRRKMQISIKKQLQGRPRSESTERLCKQIEGDFQQMFTE